MLAAATTEVHAQTPVYPVQISKFIMSGNFNSTTVAAGTKTTAALAEQSWSAAQNVLYTKLDTVSNTGVDSFLFTLKTAVNSVYVWAHANTISGTNTSCKVKLWVTGDNSTAASDWVVVDSATVGAANPVYSKLINAGVKWPYSRAKLTFTGVGTHSTSWYGGVLIR